MSLKNYSLAVLMLGVGLIIGAGGMFFMAKTKFSPEVRIIHQRQRPRRKPLMIFDWDKEQQKNLAEERNRLLEEQNWDKGQQKNLAEERNRLLEEQNWILQESLEEQRLAQ